MAGLHGQGCRLARALAREMSQYQASRGTGTEDESASGWQWKPSFVLTSTEYRAVRVVVTAQLPQWTPLQLSSEAGWWKAQDAS
ncbi:hypothetical protein O3P69_006034 [Scylla paramamosain]|uniref:Uncharacterized protein n=1 Tax=Scylla paramamosain TaxID=85552 RepID=A0AAW0U5F8_SCYPA